MENAEVMYMTKKEIIESCLNLPNTFEDRPFENDYDTTVMKHMKSKKWFALMMYVKGELYLNVKTEPEYSELLRRSYKYIIPAYHMNKQHWNTIIISDEVDDLLVKELIEQSYELTKGDRR